MKRRTDVGERVGTGMLIVGIAIMSILGAGCEIDSGYLDSIEQRIVEDAAGSEATTPPAVAITSTSTLHAELPIAVTVTFSTAVSGFEAEDILVTNAEVSSVTTSNNAVYTVELNNPADDPVDILIEVPKDVATNSFGTGNSAGSLEIAYDTSILSAMIESSVSSPTNASPIPVTITFSQEVASFGLGDITCTNCTATDLASSDHTVFTLALTPSSDGEVQMLLAAGSVESAVNAKPNVESSFTITYDGTPPTAPTVSGSTPTADLTPTWSWASGGGGNGTFRYKLNDSDLASGATTTTETSFTPDSDLADKTTHTLYVQERDDAGNWSESGSRSIAVDTSILSATITSSESSPTNSDPIPVSIAFSEDVSSFELTHLTYTNCTGSNLQGSDSRNFTLDLNPSSDGEVEIVLAVGTVESAATAGKFNVRASFAVTYDGTPPTAPTVSGTTPTADRTPTWSWTPGDGGTGNFRYKLDNSNLESGATPTDETSFTPLTNLSETTHTLYVQERDVAGNWSESGSRAIVINTAAPNAPNVSGPDRTTDRTPTWTWSSDTSSGNNSGYFRYRYRIEGAAAPTWSSEVVSTSCSAQQQADNAEITLFFEVQERSPAGVWSNAGTFTTVVDNLGPPAPNVGTSGTTSSPTQDATPTWYWAEDKSNDYADYYVYSMDDPAFPDQMSRTSVNSYTAGTLGEGLHTLYVWQQDTTGNWTPENSPGEHTIRIDFLPTGSITLRDPDNGNSSSVATDWSVTIDCSGISHADEMRFSNDGSSYTAWETKASSKSWTLAPGDGTRTVYAQFRDNDVPTTITVSDSITCNPGWGDVGASDILNWPKSEESLVGSVGALFGHEPLAVGEGFVFSYAEWVGFPATYEGVAAKVVVNSRDGTTIAVKITAYSPSYAGGPITWNGSYSSGWVAWHCSPTIYIDLNTGTTSTTLFDEADISIFYSTIYDRETITSLHGTALDRWDP